jgi:TonB family protein
LEDLHIRPKSNESRNGLLDLDLVDTLRNRFADQAQVSRFLGESFRSYAYQLADRSRPGFALYMMGCAQKEGVPSDPAVARRLLAALADAFHFTIYLPPTRSAASHPGPLVTMPRAAAEAALKKSVGSWIMISDVLLKRSLSGLVVSTSLANIKVADTQQSETRTVRYQSGWDQVPNPEYANVAEQLRQAQQNESQVASQDAANQQLAQSAVNSGGLNMFGAALVGAGAGISKAALAQAQENVNAWSAKLQSTPPTLQNAVYADEPYEATTHSISYDAAFSATIEVDGSPYADPVAWSSNYSYNTVEIAGNAAHNVPVQSATYVPMDQVVQTLADSMSQKLTDKSGEMLSRLVGATQDVLDRELQTERVPEDESADAKWGLIELWTASSEPVNQDRSRAVEVAIRSSLGLNSNSAPASSSSGGVTASPAGDENRGQVPAGVPPPISQVRSPAEPPAAEQSVATPPVIPTKIQPGYLGVRLKELTPEMASQFGMNSGTLITGIQSTGPADKAGLKIGDVITKFNGVPVTDGGQFVIAMNRFPPGTIVNLEYVRNGQAATATAALGVRPPGGFLGVQLKELTPELAAQYGTASGALVAATAPGGPADKAGLVSGDIVTKLGGEAMANPDQLALAVKELPSGMLVTVDYVRNGQTATTTVELAARSSNSVAAGEGQTHSTATATPGGGDFAIGDVDRIPALISRVDPEYPIEMRRKGISGEVLVDFVVGLTGTVLSAVALKSTQPDFNDAAIAAVRQWRFQPGIKDGREVATRMQIPITFNLDAK